jgi:hypothetical protein
VQVASDVAAAKGLGESRDGILAASTPSPIVAARAKRVQDCCVQAQARCLPASHAFSLADRQDLRTIYGRYDY